MKINTVTVDKNINERNHVTATFRRNLYQSELIKNNSFQPVCLALIILENGILILESAWSSIKIEGEEVGVAYELLKKCDGTKDISQIINILSYNITRESIIDFLEELVQKGFVCDSREIYLLLHRFACNPSPYYRTPSDEEILDMLRHPHEETIRKNQHAAELPKKNIPFAKNLIHRSSYREYDPTYEFTLEDLGTILWCMYGITSKRQIEEDIIITSHTVPSGGCLYSLEIYITIIRKIAHLNSGTYRYRSESHDLIKCKGKNKMIINSIVGEDVQNTIKDAGLLITIAGNFFRSAQKYSNRGYLYTLYEVGAVMQNCYIAVSELNLACCAIGGFREVKLAKALSFYNYPNTMPLLTILIGKALGDRQ